MILEVDGEAVEIAGMRLRVLAAEDGEVMFAVEEMEPSDKLKARILEEDAIQVWKKIKAQ
jgi:hypothetical protein